MDNPETDRTTEPTEIADPKATSSETPEFKQGMLIPFGKDHHRDTEYSFGALHNAPNKKAYRAHLENIPNRDKLPQEKQNLKLLKKAVTYTRNDAKEVNHKIVNEWHKHLTRNSECPCGSGRKWKKCHMRVMSPYKPVSHYMPGLAPRPAAQ